MMETTIRFEARELKPYREPVPASELTEGQVYFSVSFLPEPVVPGEMLVPIVQTLVFLGRDVKAGVTGQLWFQDVVSYRAGVKYGQDHDYKGVAHFISTPEAGGVGVFDYEHALNELTSCSLRRRSRGLL